MDGRFHVHNRQYDCHSFTGTLPNNSHTHTQILRFASGTFPLHISTLSLANAIILAKVVFAVVIAVTIVECVLFCSASRWSDRLTDMKKNLLLARFLRVYARSLSLFVCLSVSHTAGHSSCFFAIHLAVLARANFSNDYND